MTDNLITANHAKAWGAKLLAYVLPRQNTVAGLPGVYVLSYSFGKELYSFPEDYTMVKYLMTMTLGVFFVLIFAMGASNAIAEGGSGCEGDIKIEDGPHTYLAGPEEQVASVCIKAGQDIFYFDCTGAASSSEVYVETDGCYTVTFYAKCTDAIITGGGTDQYCKDISHTAVVFGARPASEPEPNYEDNGSDDTDDLG